MSIINLNKRKEEVGQFIRKVREEKGLSQRSFVSKGGGEFEFITQNTLVDLERGKKIPKQEILGLILRALDKTMQDLLEELDKETQVRFDNEIVEIDRLVREHAYERAKGLYDELIKAVYYDAQDPKNKQYLTFYEGVFKDTLEGEPERALQILKNGLLLRRPGLFSLTKKKPDVDKLNLNALQVTGLSFIDYRMLSGISNLYFKLNDFEASIQLLYGVISSLHTAQVSIFLKKEVLGRVYFNLSTQLLGAKRYDETIAICSKGIDWCKAIKTTLFLGELYSNKAEAYAFMKNTKIAHHFFTLAYAQLKRDGELKVAELIKVGAFHIHGMAIE